MKTTPNPVARILCPILILVSLCMIFLPWLSISAFGYTKTMSFFEIFKETFEYLGENDDALLIFVAGALLILTALLGIILSALGKKGGPIPYFIVTVLVFGAMILYINAEVGDYLSYLGVSIFSFIGIGAWLCPILALVALILALVLKGQTAPTWPAYGAAGYGAAGYGAAGYAPVQQTRSAAPVNRAYAAGGWKCPKCGTALKAEQNFCLNCGTKKPETAAPVSAARTARPAAASGWKCPGCSSVLKAEQNFCPHCGTRKPAPSAAPRGWKCPSCGSLTRDDQRFCPNCGTRKPEAAPAAPKGWKCPGCGSLTRDDQNFCPNCGTRKPEAAHAQAPRTDVTKAQSSAPAQEFGETEILAPRHAAPTDNQATKESV